MSLRFAAFLALCGELGRRETWSARLRQLVIMRNTEEYRKNHQTSPVIT